ncbi:IstB domain-containing protein ATP-binding protein [Thermincola ferriacetica]|uniref:IstB domain-containing protein ATP-binding protein n=1 Tax=Thermincola ferriacetica TaxID=281456 RepID=A0A0L6W6C8_9FIRM|nr:ATP-binding protein [Thermincola ferriacetica]KNZ70918.1 IstB domain-containing protein ATP-binding protein [Thermincola ferriacetica]
MDKVDSVLENLRKPGQEKNINLPGNGSAPVNNVQTGGCPLCHDRGLIISESGESAVPCQCMRQRSLLAKIKSAKISLSMLKCSFSQFNPNYYDKNSYDSTRGRSYYENAAIAYRLARQFVDRALKGERPDGIMFTGNVGSGKTFLACCIANALLEHGEELLFLVVPDLLDEIRATYDNGVHDVTEQELLDTARKVKYLILDDLGAHNYTEWTRNKLYSIINYRLNNQLPTVITTNLDLAELEQHLGDRTTSRIVQLCQVVRLLVDTDIRIQKRRSKDQNTDREI